MWAGEVAGGMRLEGMAYPGEAYLVVASFQAEVVGSHGAVGYGNHHVS